MCSFCILNLSDSLVHHNIFCVSFMRVCKQSFCFRSGNRGFFSILNFSSLSRSSKNDYCALLYCFITLFNITIQPFNQYFSVNKATGP